MINRLTDEQVARFPEFVDKWLAIGLSTERIDRDSANAYAQKLMKFLKRDHVSTIVLDGPIHAFVGAMMLSSQVRSQVESQVWSQVGSQVGSFIWPYMSGSFWSSWCSYFDFMQWLVAKLSDWSVVRESTEFGLIYPLEYLVVVSEKPSTLKLRDQLLHCDDGPSWLYADGTAGWSIGGVQVDEQVVMRPETQNIAQISGEQNAEIKRIRIERFGWQRYLVDIGAKPVHSRRNDVEGTRESLMKTEDGMACLVCACPSTGKVFALEVDPEIETCEQAQSYLHPKKHGFCIGAS